MKSISATFIVVIGSGLVFGGASIPHGDTAMFVQIVGVGVIAAGLWGWFLSLKAK